MVSPRHFTAWMSLACVLVLAHAPRTSAQDTPPTPPATTAPVRVADAPADADPNAARARELFQEGVAFSRSERWAEALASFQQSLALVERPSTVLNIATALQRLGRARECVAAVDRYLVISDPVADAESRARATTLRQAMTASLAYLSLALLPADAQVSINGNLAAIDAGTPLELDPGTYAFVVEREGYLTTRFTLDLSPGASTSRAVSLTQRPLDPAVLEVATQVVGARIQVDGDIVGTDEIEMEVVPGSHVVRVTADGWEPFERTLAIEAGTRGRVDAQLARPGTCQSLECEPAFWIVGGILLAGAAATAIALPIALATPEPPYGGTANFHIDALSF